MSREEGEWETVPLADVLEFQEGPGIMARDFRDDGVPLVRLAGLKRGAHLFQGCNYLDEEAVERRWSHFRLQLGDVLLSTSASLGEVAVVDESTCGAIAYTGIIAFRPKGNRILRQFIEFALRAPSFRRQIEAMGVGSVMRHFGPTHLKHMSVDLPPLRQQEAIAEVLGALDDKIAANGRIVGHAYELMRCHYKSAIADGTAATTIGSIADVFDGPHATPKKTGSGPWFLSISSLNGGSLVLEESAHLSEEDFSRWTRRVTPRFGDVLFSYETRLGEAALMPAAVRACLGRRMGLLRPREGQVGPRTLLQAFLTETFQDAIRQRAVHGATVDRIPLTELPSWPITLPARDVERLEHVLGGLDDLASHKNRENEVLASLRDTLLPKLMSGEIRVRDAEKEVEDVT